MSLTCPVDLDMLMLRREISAMDARVATAPEGEFHFHRGPAYVAGMLGYNAQELERLPVGVAARFAGVGTPMPSHRFQQITHRFDCFAGTTKERTARRYGVVGVNVSAIRAIR